MLLLQSACILKIKSDSGVFSKASLCLDELPVLGAFGLEGLRRSFLGLAEGLMA